MPFALNKSLVGRINLIRPGSKNLSHLLVDIYWQYSVPVTGLALAVFSVQEPWLLGSPFSRQPGEQLRGREPARKPWEAMGEESVSSETLPVM